MTESKDNALTAGNLPESAKERVTRALKDLPKVKLDMSEDGMLNVGLGGDSFTDVSIPSGSMRVGFPISPRVSIEPKGRLSVASANSHTVTTYRVEVGALYHFDEAAMQRSGLYARPALGLSGFSGDNSENTFYAGIGVGLKKPILGQLGARYEAAFLHNFNNGSANELELSAGLSWFTH